MEEVTHSTRAVLADMITHKETEWAKLEKILLTIDGGTIALSVSYFSNSTTAFIHAELLKYSWTLLVLALLALLISYAFSEIYLADLIRKVKKANRNTITGSDIENFKNRNIQSGIMGSNYLSLLFTTVGIVLLAVFGSFNIG